jgi:hypothetical protein
VGHEFEIAPSVPDEVQVRLSRETEGRRIRICQQFRQFAQAAKPRLNAVAAGCDCAKMSD